MFPLDPRGERPVSMASSVHEGPVGNRQFRQPHAYGSLARQDLQNEQDQKLCAFWFNEACFYPVSILFSQSILSKSSVPLRKGRTRIART